MSLGLSNGKIEDLLKKDFDVIYKDCVTSTNDELVTLAKSGAKEGTVLISNEQTAGKGRTGKSFYSPKGTGVYLSILLRPNFTPEDTLSFTTMAAVATAKAIESVSDKEAKIKWVNDIYINRKKVCGILTESSLNPSMEKQDYVVVGIGINLAPPKGGFPEDIKNIATTVFDKEPDSNIVSKLVAHLLDYFMDYYKKYDSNNHMEEYMNRIITLD